MTTKKSHITPQRIHRSEFLRLLRAGIPEVEPYLQGMRDGTTTEMSAFLRLTQEAIRRHDPDSVKRAFSLAAELLARGNADIRNAVAVVFLEDLDLESPECLWATPLLPDSLATERARVYSFLGNLLNRDPSSLTPAARASEEKPRGKKRGHQGA
jgi:hypothetical protein